MKEKKTFSTHFQSENRTYFLDVKTSREGIQYLQISESKRIGKNEFERYQIILFDKAIEKFADKINEIAKEIRSNKKSYAVKEKRKTHRNLYKPWTKEDDNRLELLYCEGKGITKLTKIFGRNEGAIRSRIKKLELKEK